MKRLRKTLCQAGRAIFCAAALFMAGNAPARAAIQIISFTGTGNITYSRVNAFPVGTPTIVTGQIDLGSHEVADDFSGEIILDLTEQSFVWATMVGASGASDRFNAYQAGRVSLTRGRLTDLNLFADSDTAFSDLGLREFRQFVQHQPDPANDGLLVAGHWRLSSPVPAPDQWAMMLAGFGVVGTSIRHQQKRPERFRPGPFCRDCPRAVMR